MTAHELRELRARLKLTQAQMAERLGIGPRMYAYIEAGIKPLSKAGVMLAEQMAKTSSEPATAAG